MMKKITDEEIREAIENMRKTVRWLNSEPLTVTFRFTKEAIVQLLKNKRRTLKSWRRALWILWLILRKRIELELLRFGNWLFLGTKL